MNFGGSCVPRSLGAVRHFADWEGIAPRPKRREEYDKPLQDWARH